MTVVNHCYIWSLHIIDIGMFSTDKPRRLEVFTFLFSKFELSLNFLFNFNCVIMTNLKNSIIFSIYVVSFLKQPMVFSRFCFHFLFVIITLHVTAECSLYYCCFSLKNYKYYYIMWKSKPWKFRAIWRYTSENGINVPAKRGDRIWWNSCMSNVLSGRSLYSWGANGPLIGLERRN